MDAQDYRSSSRPLGVTCFSSLPKRTSAVTGCRHTVGMRNGMHHLVSLRNNGDYSMKVPTSALLLLQRPSGRSTKMMCTKQSVLKLERMELLCE